MAIFIEGVVSPKIGLVSHQNAVPLLRALAIENRGEESLEHLTLELETSLPFATPKSWKIDRVAGGSTVQLPDRDVELKAGYLADLSEGLKAEVRLRVTQGSEVLAQQSFPIELLARNEWGGSRVMPELLAAFCMPNDPAIDKVLKSASNVLRRAGRPDAIDGYQEKSRQRVWELASAIWSAVCSYQISYSVPPASFEIEGQKIRPPAQIFDGGVGTCLDMALLFSAAMEQAGLNPVVLLTDGHAFSGAWLQPQEFAQVVDDDASAVRKRIELQELIVFETTLATQSPAPRFRRAIDAANRQLTDNEFRMSLDVRRARMQKVRPLTATTERKSNEPGAQAPNISEALEAAPELPGFDVEVDGAPDTPAGKLELWQRKLLDLTTRNRLLHLPERAKAIRLVCPDPAGLEDLLAAGKSVRIVPMARLDIGGRDSSIYEQRNEENLEEEFARQSMTRFELPSKMEKEKLDATLVDIYRKAKADLEEGGSNTLFLAVGFLCWKKSEDDPQIYSAPLILLPVKLERRSVLSDVKMSLLDEESRFNLTLLELLRHDFNLNIQGLSGDLPTDQSGIDVEGIWNIVRHAVRDVPGFEVTKDVVLGTFSFAKYLMWRDLIDRSDMLMQNPVVRHLLEHKFGSSALESDSAFPSANTLDQEIAPCDLFTPLPADSSQLAAVVASAKGYSFVLDGPPGTGKSQTIANMIAHNLALGRRVLFVAEKMAALDVVKRRLDEKGIGGFCLELHSSKTSKSHVLQQLDRAWTSRDDLAAEDWQTQAEKIRSLRDNLNRIVSVLHRRWPNGWSVYEAVGRAVRDATSLTPRFSWSTETQHSKEQMAALRDLARRLELNRAIAESIGSRMNLLSRTEWSNSWQESMVAAAIRVLKGVEVCDQACVMVNRHIGLSLKCSTPEAKKLLQFVKLLPDAYGIDLRFAFDPSANRILAAAQQANAIFEKFDALKRRLSYPYSSATINRIEVQVLRHEWEDASDKFWILAARAKRKVARSIANIGDIENLPDVAVDLPILEEMKALIREFEALDEGLRAVPGWALLETDRMRMLQATNLADSLRHSMVQLAGSPEALVQLKREVQRLIVEGNELLHADGQIAMSVCQLETDYAKLCDAIEGFSRASNSEISLESQIPELLINAQTIVENEAALNAWCGWQRARQESVANGLQALVEAIERNSLLGNSVSDVFEVAYARWFATKAIDAEPLLRNFVPAEHQSDIEAFRAGVDELEALTAKYIRAKLSGGIPDKNGVTRSSGFGILKHELQKSRRHKPVRQLTQQMGKDFTALARCMLMSPLSIAQYLPTDHELFDLVIFDEASQIAPWDAVGSIARGRQVVVAGDPRQMPPTSFFNRAAGVDEDDTDEDLESILDECIGAGVPQHNLTWHYRSRHESLITFSNYHYYEGSLITFPAADTRPSAVGWRYVEGIYSRGKGRHNQIEAKAIVDEVVKRLTDSEFVASRQSIGIITLNAEQQTLVDDLLDEARRKNPAIESFFGGGLAEPVVVKNLETMQGDERDLIILGIGFGPTEIGANVMSMNFGPLNRDGGWRRLNVAVTRARREMLVFTSFEPAMIDLNRTSAGAVRDLRYFIEFAHQGPKAIRAAVHGSMGGYDSPFEQYVADGLRAKGWEIRSQIGVSRFRIDLGVVHPDRPGDYLVGVECDGASYHSAATARDRDKVRSEILRGLGWRLVRVWSTEWWVDRDGALERLDQTIKAVLQESRANALMVAEERRKSTVDRGRVRTGNERGGGAGSRSAPMVSGREGRAAPPSDSAADESVTSSTRKVARMATSNGGTPLRRIYRKTDLRQFRAALKPERFQEESYNAILVILIRQILEQEAPILDKALVDRVARAHGFKRSGRLIRERVLEVTEEHFHVQREQSPEQCYFAWLSADDPERWNCFRVPKREDDIRFIEEIALVELAVASRSVRGEDMPVEVARAFAVKRLSNEARARILAAAHMGANVSDGV